MFPEGNYLDAEVILPGDWLLATPQKKDHWSKIGFPKVFGAAQRDSPGVALPYQPPRSCLQIHSGPPGFTGGVEKSSLVLVCTSMVWSIIEL